MSSEPGEGEVALLRRLPEPDRDKFRLQDVFFLSPSKLHESFRWFYCKLVYGEYNFDHLPYGFRAHRIRSRKAAEKGIPFDLSRRNYEACTSLYKLAQMCIDGKIPVKKQKCQRWVDEYMVSCVTEQDKAAAAAVEEMRKKEYGHEEELCLTLTSA